MAIFEFEDKRPRISGKGILILESADVIGEVTETLQCGWLYYKKLYA